MLVLKEYASAKLLLQKFLVFEFRNMMKLGQDIFLNFAHKINF